jgi:DNA-binding NarL/FixJ family response regulator
MTRLLIIDDHPIVRQGLKQLLEQQPDFSAIDEADSAAEAIKIFNQHRPDVVILDLALGDTSGLNVIKLVQDIDANVPVLILSMHDESLHAERALRAGARGYVMKQEATDTVIQAVRQVLKGDIYLSERMQSRALRSMLGGKHGEVKMGFERLTDREAEILRLIGIGLSSAQIAQQLHRSIKTVEAHRAAIRDKLDLKNANDMMRVAIQYAESFPEHPTRQT